MLNVAILMGHLYASVCLDLLEMDTVAQTEQVFATIILTCKSDQFILRINCSTDSHSY